MVKVSSVFVISFSSALFLSSSVRAAAYFLPDYEEKLYGGIHLHSRIEDEQQRCFSAGYTITSCPEGSAAKESERCPYSLDKVYYKQCYSLASFCIEKGYTTSCEAGYEADTSKVCSYDSTYTKCKAAECSGYRYSEAEANAAGYIPDGEPCLSGSEYVYQRKPHPCTGFNYDTSNCGVSECGILSGETCQSGSVLKYQACDPCAAPVPECSAGQVDLDNYWCNGALKCWWK